MKTYKAKRYKRFPFCASFIWTIEKLDTEAKSWVLAVNCNLLKSLYYPGLNRFLNPWQKIGLWQIRREHHSMKPLNRDYYGHTTLVYNRFVSWEQIEMTTPRSTYSSHSHPPMQFPRSFAVKKMLSRSNYVMLPWDTCEKAQCYIRISLIRANTRFF